MGHLAVTGGIDQDPPLAQRSGINYQHDLGYQWKRLKLVQGEAEQGPA